MGLPGYRSLKSEAKRLQHAVRAGDDAAIARLAAHGFDTAEPISRADCLHVVATEHGFASWPRLKLHLRALGMSRHERIRELEASLADGQHHIVDKLLEIDPSLSDAHFGIQLALVDAQRVRTALAADPALATRPIGRRTPLLHLCFSKRFQAHPELQEETVNLAELLLDAGADPKAFCRQLI